MDHSQNDLISTQFKITKYMKFKTLTFLVALLTTLSGYTQTVYTEDVEIQGKLEVTGNLGGQGFTLKSTSGAGVTLDRAATHNNAHVRFATSGTIFGSIGADNDGTNNLYWGTGGFANKYLTLQEGGKIGIGTTTPDQLLTVAGNVNIGGAGSHKLKVRYINGKSASSTGLGILRLNNDTTSPVYVGSQESNSDLYVLGRQGIGTNSPNADLEIYKYNGSSELRLHTNQHAGIALLEIAGGSALLDSNPDNYSGWSIFHSHNSTNKDLYFRHGQTGDPNVVFADNGNVGIGTNDPTETLSVNGTIRSKEIICEISPWPDYVFEDNYQLKSLNELEQFIDKEGHLPNIPSAEEVEEDGVTLGKMNALLLEKIEELTLLMIKLQKEKDVEVQELARQIEVLKNSNQ